MLEPENNNNNNNNNNIVLSERSQTQKAVCGVLSFTGHVQIGKSVQTK